MTPAFSTKTEAIAFAAFLTAIVLLPWFTGSTLLPPRESIYSSVAWRFGGHAYFGDEIFSSNDDIDIAFLGSSRIWCGVNAQEIESQLAKQLGRKPKVITFGWNTAGFDAAFFIGEDLLRNRKVKLLVINDEFNPDIDGTAPHRLASRWFRYGDNFESLQGLPFRGKLGYYGCAVLGMPRNLVGLLRNNLEARSAPEQPFSPEKLYASENPRRLSGSLRTARNYLNPDRPFVSLGIKHQDTSEFVISSPPQGTEKFRFTSTSMPELQKFFARKLAALAESHGTQLVVLNFPSTHAMASSTIDESMDWSRETNGRATMIGIPAKDLFMGLSEKEVFGLFSDPKHFNLDGQDYFTRIITPSVLRAYHETSTK